MKMKNLKINIKCQKILASGNFLKNSIDTNNTLCYNMKHRHEQQTLKDYEKCIYNSGK